MVIRTSWKRPLWAASLFTISLSATGCATLGENARGHMQAYNANSHTLDKTHVTAFVSNEIAVFGQFRQLAGIPSDATNLRPVVDAGIHYVDVRCTGYLQAVFWLNRAKNASSRQAQLFGSTAAAAMEVLNASRELIALTPLGFTMLNDTIENVGNSLLFAMPPETVGQLVAERQRAYVTGLSDTYTNQASALRAIQGYAELCLSNNIEAAALDAIASRRFVVEEDVEEEVQAEESAPVLPPAPVVPPAPVIPPAPIVPPAPVVPPAAAPEASDSDAVPTIRGV